MIAIPDATNSDQYDDPTNATRGSSVKRATTTARAGSLSESFAASVAGAKLSALAVIGSLSLPPKKTNLEISMRHWDAESLQIYSEIFKIVSHASSNAERYNRYPHARSRAQNFEIDWIFRFDSG